MNMHQPVLRLPYHPYPNAASGLVDHLGTQLKELRLLMASRTLQAGSVIGSPLKPVGARPVPQPSAPMPCKKKIIKGSTKD